MPQSDNVVAGRYACASKWDYEAQTPAEVKLYEITGWSFTEANSDAGYVSCETGGIRKRVDGDYDITGSLTGVVRVDHPIRDAVKVGDEFLLRCFVRRPAVGVTGLYHQIPVRVLSIDDAANLEEAGPQRWTLNWGLSVNATYANALFDQESAALTTPAP